MTAGDFIVVSAVGQDRITEDAFNLGAFYYIFNFIVAWIMEYIEKKMRY